MSEVTVPTQRPHADEAPGFGPYGIDHLLTDARGDLDRVDPRGAAELQRNGALLIDIRPESNRLAEGEIPGALNVERIVLEWRLDPSSPHRLDGLRVDQPVVLVCNEGYASSLAAAQARELGLGRATDLIGGFRAWRAAGLPVEGGHAPVG
ncbi:rhodanese-like domain-containing protein [Saccharopolyspora gloriosae]|uniref:Rhodanese-related sulfurtransferase n=1 Tax=Saccharopolyspora gloriosae TaxID=455344 RepID=A0A840NMK2_9PSEU|nr:rhodanese-like domain-containing protein [Saccharopolyspora gloriosae]MBB5071548.1 rhodanese-related sulfurtransferase [Saccharopolyspora gloriosae]